MNLNRSDVVFIEETHKYFNGDKELIGITGIISKMLFPNKYSGISEGVLRKAAERGSIIHSKCQTFDMFGGEWDCPEVENYAKIKKDNNLVAIENEYLVTDNERVATMIDVVFEDTDDTVHLGDFKTTYSLDVESLSWQLSICARLFELQNPHLKVGKLYGIWLRGDKSKLQEVNRISDVEVDKLLDAYFSGGEYINPTLMITNTDEIKKLVEVEQFIISLKEEADALEAQKKALLDGIEKQMELNDVKRWETDNIVLTRVLPTTSVTFDAKKFKEDNPELAAKYEKKSNKKGYLKLKIK